MGLVRAQGLASMQRHCSMPRRIRQAVFTTDRREQLRALLHQNPPTFGKPPGVWTLNLAAEVVGATWVPPSPVNSGTIRYVLATFHTR
jgi:hypothetical protein